MNWGLILIYCIYQPDNLLQQKHLPCFAEFTALETVQVNT